MLHGVITRKSALDEDRVQGGCGVLEAVNDHFLSDLRVQAQAQEELFFDRQGIFDGVVEAFGHSLDSEDGLNWKVDEDVLHQLIGLENGLYRRGCGRFFCVRHFCEPKLVFLARSII